MCAKGLLMADVQTRVQALLDRLVERDLERGLQVAAFLDGELIVDAWAGIADPATGRPVDGETLFTVWSAGKGVAATVLHLLAERGLLAYDAPIATYWPEFGTNAKQAITVRHALTHTAGIPQLPDGVSPTELLDWETMCRRIADLAPLWPPGTATGYHAMTYGWTVGELARRVDGRPFATIVQQEICAPLEIDALFFGIPDAVEPRVATLEEAPTVGQPAAPATELSTRVVPPWRHPAYAWANRPEVRRACLPSSGAIMNARSLARHYAALAGGQGNGKPLLSPERIQVASELAIEAMDRVLGVPVRRALGYHLGEPLSSMSKRSSAFGHAGAGGTIGFADPTYRFAFALTKNRMVNAPPGEDAAYLVAREVRGALHIPEAG
jgi:CubicO group peptidase (beta-lactamase class C family)